ncbi:NAD-dependent epimerase [Fimbriimonas ginsengisoli]|uniref:NAD-dependent epimerase/dehydratase n=1 Tax=Fimbriimonas ginsengisoli Gsoil 348 TaxID=661478 RepID=A0A068NN48_FIMGI|nr:NAD-dependent epimerase [Fimbriimonas ginsengisoli]AIE84827.1 NAD-dependent epimerase/dehydratase [Fimbriimonas ginsengisoli Gsoil 348]
MAKILVTGAAGFIGYHASRRLLEQGHEVVGLDNMNLYYDVSLKEGRLAELRPFPGFRFVKASLEDAEAVDLAVEGMDAVIHLAAQAGVRYSLENPRVYVQSNVVGFLNILESCRAHPVKHLVYASSSSVYGGNKKMPFSTEDRVDHPVSLYAATKKSNELMAHVYSHLFDLPTTGLRFFTVYGPWGRPDMAPTLFTQAILEGKPIKVFNNGDMRRDFTYVGDIVSGIVSVLDRPPVREGENAPYRLFNIGNSEPVQLLRFIEILEHAIGREAEKVLLPMQPGDVPATFSDTSDLERLTGFRPLTSLEEGIPQFVEWYRRYYAI